MRLGTCIVVEILVGAGMVSALGAGTAWGVERLRHGGVTPDVVAEAEPDPESTTPAPTSTPTPTTVGVTVDAGVSVDAGVVAEAATPAEPEPVVEGEGPAWNRGGHDDVAALEPLRNGKVTRVKFNHGGMTLSLRLDFDNGARAAFKPDQTNAQSNPRKEIAAFRIDRLLGIDRVPPSFGRTFSEKEIEAAVQGTERVGLERLRDEGVAHEGELRGELSWWIPVIADGYVNGYRIDSTDGIVTWRKYLQPGAKIPEKDLLLCQQISTMLVFDFLVDDTDRWSGNNAKTSEDGHVLYFMDNTMSFSTKKKGHTKSQTYLNRVHTFSKSLIAHLRAITAEDVKAALADDLGPFDHLLTSAEIEAMMARRDVILDYVDGLIADHGEDEVLAFP